MRGKRKEERDRRKEKGGKRQEERDRGKEKGGKEKGGKKERKEAVNSLPVSLNCKRELG